MNTYPPNHHQEDDYDNIKRTVKTFPLATLISVSKNVNNAVITHVPLIYEDDGSTHGKLIGHLDRYNPHCKLLSDRYVQAIFHGPDTYISPKNYTTEQLPTWNYIKVHIEGICRIINSMDRVKQSIVNMTEFLEKGDEPYILEKDNDKMDQLINYVVGFEIEILNWEGKYKLSQDKIADDQLGAKQALIENPKNQIENFVPEIYQYHKTQRSK